MFYVVVRLKIKQFLFFLLFTFILDAKEHRVIPLSKLFQTELILKSKTFKIWLAIDPQQKSEGLSHLSSDTISEKNGMLFIYPFAEKLSFWMKETQFDLDIAYIDSEGTIVDIFTMKKMQEQKFNSTKKVRYALELKAESFKKMGFKVGDTIVFSEIIKELSKP